MAFGFGFNKQKVLSAAEKFVQQGKLQNAIAEYEKILKADAKDLTVMNTVGDLYSRLGENDKAVECFKSVGDAYASQGFTVKAIAMYKKIAKSKPSVEGVLKLAELYTQQGLFNDARAQYLQVAEEFLRSGELDQAVRIFQKTLEMDPENLAMRLRLADVYVRLNKKNEAREVYSAAIESLRAKGQLDAAEEVLQRLVKLDPGGDSQLLRVRNAIDTGDFAGAAKILEQLPDLNTNQDAQRNLFRCYLQLGQLPEARALAPKLFADESNTACINSYVEALLAAGQYDEVLALYQTYLERLLADDATRFLNSLHSIIGPLSDNTGCLEAILDLLGRAGDKSHDAEIMELLGHAYVQSGDFEKARDCYAQLMQLEPQNAVHAQNYQQVMGRISSGGASSSALITPEEGVVLVDELEATAPFIDQETEDGVAPTVRAAITDAELYLSYNMPDKALAPLLSVLPQAPRDLRLNQRLSALHTRAGRFADAAICCRTLESIYHDANHASIAERYGDLASKFEAHGTPAPDTETVDAPAVVADQAEEAAHSRNTSAPIAVPEVPEAEVQAPAAISDVQEFSVQSASPETQEIDLSGEWDGSHLAEATPAPEPAAEAPVATPEVASSNDLAVAETIEEIRFYLETSMPDQAKAAMVKLEQLTSDPAMLSALRGEIDAAVAKAAPAPDSDFAVVVDSGPTIEEDTIPQAGVAAVEEVQIVEPPQPQPEEPIAAVAPPVAQPVAPPIEAIPAPAAVAPPAPEPAPAAAVLNDIVADLESSLGKDFLPEVAIQPEGVQTPAIQPNAPAAVAVPAPPLAPAAQPVPPAPVGAPQPAAAAPSGPLGEFVSDLESSLGENFLAATPATAAPVPKAAAPAHAPVAAMSAAASASAGGTPLSAVPPTPPSLAKAAYDPSAGVDLANMFGELKHELEEETATADEDPETHYNLGVAFREMGLLDEAIGELQKVCQAVERGHSFGSMMQTYTWLAQCFLDKGVPEAAIRWYQSALKLPNLDAETIMALNYELASACEGAGDKPAALANFMKVYSTNIDYRDVSERIKALKS